MDHPRRLDPRTADIVASHHVPQDIHDRIALRLVKILRVFADRFFASRYGHRAVVLETVAAVPGMVGGLLQHLKAIRHIREDQGWIKELIDEADNERMHLMTFIHIARPSRVERLLIMVAQAIFYNFYFFLYLFAPRTAHRVVGYLEEEAVVSYTQYLAQIDSGAIDNLPRAADRAGVLVAARRCAPARGGGGGPRRRGAPPRHQPRLRRRDRPRHRTLTRPEPAMIVSDLGTVRRGLILHLDHAPARPDCRAGSVCWGMSNAGIPDSSDPSGDRPVGHVCGHRRSRPGPRHRTCRKP